MYTTTTKNLSTCRGNVYNNLAFTCTIIYGNGSWFYNIKPEPMSNESPQWDEIVETKEKHGWPEGQQNPLLLSYFFLN